jgi:hypothetical protein
MSSFINKNANVSQTVLLTSILKPLLENYNKFLLSRDNLNLNCEYHLIPNNNQKYFLYISQKNKLERIGSNQKNYNILYFFPDKISKEYYSNNKLEYNKLSDFYIEIDLVFSYDILLEGYLYRSKEGKLHYLLTDILYKNTDLITFDYKLRYNLLNEIFMPLKKNLINLNDHLYINLHPMFNNINENMITIFKHNFIFKEQLCCLEKIELFSKERSIIVDYPSEGNTQENTKDYVIKLIEKTKYADVYNVFDKVTNNKQGILYIKGVKDSKYIKELFNKNSNSIIEHECIFNKNFNKWQINPN